MTTEEKALATTHQCTICGALWRECDDFSWTLCSTQCGSCCDNVPMGSQIVSISEAREADKKAFSDAAKTILNCTNVNKRYGACLALSRFILPEPEPDPLVEVFRRLPLDGDAGCDKLTDAEWAKVAEVARLAIATKEAV